MLSYQKIPETVFNVNDLSEEIHHNRDLILGCIFREAVLSHQETLLRLNLGGRYQRKRIEASFACPDCGIHKFTRNGKRRRVYKCVIGKIKLFMLQIKCSSCGHRFCPYKDLIDLSFIDRISQGLIARQMDLTCHIPYAKAQNFIRLCLETAVSPVTVRKAINRKTEQIRFQPVTAKDRVVYEDSTKVKAGDRDRGISIHLAFIAKPYSL